MVTEITGATDACQGDSGGPLVTLQDPSRPNKTVLIGVISRGEGCAMNGFTATYTRVSAFYNWIVDSIQQEDEKYWKCKK
ncbi:hypodermin-B [Eurytemora carolleeae]|uniref:hypodermin-B n=1 Tax=Eurytemora carolleeae TaxID=1294199 RepID=UPI000C7786EB|nr:hypodermin-B [Eurytemora carolleeae]|eukprot:XP_023337399.1 hypodermin-B-like [Eurytemora affinis]